MVYWSTESGAEYDTCFPLLSPLTDAERENGNIHFVLQNNVGRWEIDGSGWDWFDTPGWIRVPVQNPEDLVPGQNWPIEGEYTYEMHIEVIAPDTPEDYSNRIVSKGIAIFGDYADPRPRRYEQEITYQQYGQELL